MLVVSRVMNSFPGLGLKETKMCLDGSIMSHM